jgi:uncharacterized protein (DUF169 family)
MTAALRAIAEQLRRDLELDTPPVQVSYLEEPPPDVDAHPGGVPSVCTYFAQGTGKSFYAGLRQHEDCEIGAFVLGIPPEGDLGRRLLGTLSTMQAEGYLNPGEETKVPHNLAPPKFVAYGPLGSLAAPPTGVLLFAKPRAAMLAIEAAQSGPDAAPVPLNGRPMCSILPILNQGARVAVSFGCIGSRIYTSMGEDKVVVGIRGDHLGPFVQSLGRILRANRAVADEDTRRKAESAHAYSPPSS